MAEVVDRPGHPIRSSEACDPQACRGNAPPHRLTKGPVQKTQTTSLQVGRAQGLADLGQKLRMIRGSIGHRFAPF
jgi:hypothetical protein